MSELRPLKLEQDEWRYAPTPRRKKLPPPSVGVFDEPFVTWRINREWLSHVSGMVDVLSDQDMWLGDIDEITFAIRQIAALLASDWDCGMEDIRVEDCVLQKLVDGVWENVYNLELCGDGGGGLASIKAVTRYQTLGANATFTNTAYAEIAITEIAWTPTKSKALIGISGALSNSAAQSVFIRPIIKQGATIFNGIDDTQGRSFGTSQRETWAWDVFDSYALTNSGILFEAKVSGGTGTLAANFDIEYVILEFESLDDIFVQDIRILDGELQKKIGGVWINVDESLAAILAAIEATADSALSIANGAVTVNNTQNTRLNNLESFQEDAELELAQHTLTLANHESRIDALEASSGADSPYFIGGVGGDSWEWSDLHIHPEELVPWELDQGNASSNGIASVGSSPSIVEFHMDSVLFNQITHVGVDLISGTVGVPLDITCFINGLNSAGFDARVNMPTWVGGIHTLWLRVPNDDSGLIRIECINNSGNFFYVHGVKLLWRGTVSP